MSGPEAHVPASGEAALEGSKDDVLDAARPLPTDDDMAIENLSDEKGPPVPGRDA